jgi:uncharacterized protein
MSVPVPLRPLRLNLVELLRQPGAERHAECVVDAADLGCIVPDPATVDIVGPIVVTVDAVSGVDDVEVRTRVAVPWAGPCRRCLQALRGEAVTTVVERFAPEGSPVVGRGGRADDEVLPVAGDQIDLAPTVRDTAVLELPVAPLCSAECRGLCAECGADLNAADCGCRVEVVDERWAALDALRGELGHDS